MALENIDFSININYLILTILLIFAVGYSYYIYRHTIPATSTFIKIVLISLRSFALILIITVLFEPFLSFNYLQENKPINLLFVDNSSSITHKDSIAKSNKVHKFIADYQTKTSSNIKISTFGKVITPVAPREKVLLNFNEATTNFENLLPFIKKQKENIATITIISDGIITDGSNSTNEIEKLNIPFFTVAIGDTTKPSDIGIKKVEFNKLIYRDKVTEIKGVVSNVNFGNKSIVVSLFDKLGIVEQKQIRLNESGINNIIFDYKPNEIGKQHLTLKISQLDKEETYTNNKYSFLLDIIDDKTNVLVIAGAPSHDLSFILKSLKINDNIKVNNIIQIAENKFMNNIVSLNKLDSADVIIMIDFPSSKTPQNLLSDVNNNLRLKNTSFFLILSESTDYSKLKNFNKSLPFRVGTISKNHSNIQPKIISTGNGIIRDLALWNNLAPINTNDTRITIKKGTSLLSTTKKNNRTELPLLFINKVGSTRKIVFNGYNFWKWKLQSAPNSENLFDSFLTNSIKWLSTTKEKTSFIATTKDIFSSNEQIEFLGNIYDETLTAINDASIEIEIFSDNFRKSLILSASKNGIYTGYVDISKSGLFNYTATITTRNKEPNVVKGKFLISDSEVENISFVLNSNYLSFISNITSGKSFNIDNYSDLFEKINQLSEVQTKQEVISEKFEMWRSDLVLFLIILLFAMEWIIRKQKGML